MSSLYEIILVTHSLNSSTYCKNCWSGLLCKSWSLVIYLIISVLIIMIMYSCKLCTNLGTSCFHQLNVNHQCCKWAWFIFMCNHVLVYMELRLENYVNRIFCITCFVINAMVILALHLQSTSNVVIINTTSTSPPPIGHSMGPKSSIPRYS